MALVNVKIGRTSGPCTDVEVESDFDLDDPETIDIIKDVLAMVNKVTGDKDGWYVVVTDGRIIIPTNRT